MEVALFGLRTIILENEAIRIMFVLDKGTEIIEFNYKQTDTDFMYRSHMGLSSLGKMQYGWKDEQLVEDTYTGGWYEMFPNIGGVSKYKNALIPRYGEVCHLPWEYSILRDDPTEVSIRCFVRTTKTPFFVDKVFSIKSGIPSLFIQESAKNTSKEDVHYQWAHHPNIGGNFIDESCTIEMQAGESVVVYSPGEKRLKDGSVGQWPILKGENGIEVDLSKIQSPECGFCDVVHVYDLKMGRVVVKCPKKMLGIEFEWDPLMFKHIGVWQVTNGDTGYPRYSDIYVLGLIPFNDRNRGIEESVKRGTCSMLKAGDTVKTWITATVLRI